MVAGPHTSVCISSPNAWAGGLILTLGIGKVSGIVQMCMRRNSVLQVRVGVQFDSRPEDSAG